MKQISIEQFITNKVSDGGMVETAIKGVHFFNITESINCAPAVYEPSITAIVRGEKEAIINGTMHFYNNQKYICCSMSMPIEAGTPTASQENPLIGIYIKLDTRMMTELVLEVASTANSAPIAKNHSNLQGLSTATWDEDFTLALHQLIELDNKPTDLAILEKSRLRELYYTILKGSAGYSFRNAFGIGNEIARSIEFLSSNLNQSITIDDMASQIGMSRAVFHRKFKQATNMSPIQFIKAMRLNSAATKIAQGTNVNIAAMDVGYVSSSQFSREFKRMYGLSPKQWRLAI